MVISIEQLRRISKNRAPKDSIMRAMVQLSAQFQPYEFAHVNAQIAHESGGYYYDREVWGPTPAQERYDIRTDLGNTPERDGDGEKYRGYGPLQVTGKANVTEFRDWCRERGLNPPDFVKEPHLIAESPWMAWSIVWYWSTRKLSNYAASNDIEMITRRINGGLNGYADRLDYYDRTALVMLGYGPEEIARFQDESPDYSAPVDGVSGPKTRAAMHKALTRLSSVPVKTKPAPVTNTPPSLEKPWYKSKEVIAPIVTGGGLGSIATFFQSLGGMPWQNLAIIIAAAFLGLAAFLVISRQRDKRAVS